MTIRFKPMILRALAVIATLALSATSHAALITATSTGNGAGPVAVSSTDLLQTSVSSVTNTGAFTRESGGGLGVMTDGSFGATVNNVNSTVATAGDNGGDTGSLATYNFDLSGAPLGFDITTVDIFSGWNDNGRDQILVELLYSDVSAPGTFISLGAPIDYNGASGGQAPWNRATVTDDSGTIATGVAAIQFNFDLDVENGHVGYREIDVLGTATAGPAVPEPASIAIWSLLGLCLAGYGYRRRKS